MGTPLCRVELRQLPDRVQIWIAADVPAGLRGVRDLISELLTSADGRTTLSSVPGVAVSGFDDLQLELADSKGWIRPIVRAGERDQVFLWVGSREDWLMCRDLVDGVISGTGPGFQWLTGNVNDAAEVLVERLS